MFLTICSSFITICRIWYECGKMWKLDATDFSKAFILAFVNVRWVHELNEVAMMLSREFWSLRSHAISNIISVDKECVSIPIETNDQEVYRHMQTFPSVHQGITAVVGQPQRSEEASSMNGISARMNSFGSMSMKRHSREVRIIYPISVQLCPLSWTLFR